MPADTRIGDTSQPERKVNTYSCVSVYFLFPSTPYCSIRTTLCLSQPTHIPSTTIPRDTAMKLFIVNLFAVVAASVSAVSDDTGLTPVVLLPLPHVLPHPNDCYNEVSDHICLGSAAYPVVLRPRM